MDLRDNFAKASINSAVGEVTVSLGMPATIVTVELPAQGLRHLSFACVGSEAAEDDWKHPEKRRRRRRARVENDRLSDEFEDAAT